MVYSLLKVLSWPIKSNIYFIINYMPSLIYLLIFLKYIKEMDRYDFIVFSSQTIGSLSAGYLLYLTNWQNINLFSLPLLLLIIYTSYKVKKNK